MQKVEIHEITEVSGIILTKRAIEAIDSYQTGGTLDLEDWSQRSFSNEFIDENIAKTDELIRFLIVNFCDETNDIEEISKHLLHLADIVYFFNCFKLPQGVLSSLT